MTRERLKRELAYHASMSPFGELLKNGVISEQDYQAIEALMRRKYAPIFSAQIAPEPLDITENQR
ncbi:MAG: hypothetical protein BWY35_01947 [Firmicutes bacterium ADurb.Bin248]|nr:MAG: hypothetical protein BWY35_01947 [Firmicutes bacterium ADurb.Bin248]